MIINHDRRWLIITPPKTASTTLRKMFLDQRNSKEACCFSGYQHDATVPAGCHDYAVFATVRNPYERAVSLWWHRMWDMCKEDGIGRAGNRRKFPRDILDEYPFSQFVGWITNTETPFFSWPCIRWFRFLPSYSILRVESLSSDLRRVNLMRAGDAVPHENRTNHGPARSYYTADVQDAIWRLFRDDFQAFDYPEDLP